MRATCASMAHRCALLAKRLPMVLDCLDVNSLLPGRGKLGGYTSSCLRSLLNFLRNKINKQGVTGDNLLRLAKETTYRLKGLLSENKK